MKFETLAVHAAPPDAATGAVAPPIHVATTFARDESYELPHGYSYVREGNPTQSLLEDALARLEGGACSLVFGSGMGAGMALVQAIEPGAHVVLPEDVYHGFRVAAVEYFAKLGIAHDFVPMEETEALRRAIRPETRLVWIETPSNPLLKIVDLNAAIGLAHEAGALALVDGTFATPALQRPIAAGADLVLHASTKYLGGHSDVQGGALVFSRRDSLFDAVGRVRKVFGAVASPFNSWLVLRGLRTLPCRMDRHGANALAVARFLEGHSSVAGVHYPGLPSDPGHERARDQMRGFGGMLSFRVRGGEGAALAVARSTRLFLRATSLGGVESLIEHRRTVEGEGSNAPPDLLRLSVGLEHPDDLIEDLSRALS